MEIIPLAFDSLGTRSMCTFLKTKDCKILIDPGVALGPWRYSLPPHPIEYQRLDEHWQTIKKFAKKADVLIVTHYHYDHHDPSEPELYRDKRVYIKHPTQNINRSQRERAAYFLAQIQGMPKVLEYSDSTSVSFGKTNLKFSDAVPHGTNVKLGYVTEVSICDDKCKLVYTSDVEGPSLDNQTEFVLDEKPDIIMCDGPMTYMLGYRYSAKSLEISVENMIRILNETKVKKFILDHHFLRDLRWRERIKEVFSVAQSKKIEILTAAEFAGKENDLLEARRKELFGR